MKVFIFILVLAGIIGAGLGYQNWQYSQYTEKLYVAAETDGIITVVDPKSRQVINKIDLSTEVEGAVNMYSPHNVQVSPDNKTVWVTANVHHMDETGFRLIESARAHGGAKPDELVVISALTDKILTRITTVPEAHLAHVVFTPDGRFAYATAQEQGMIYKIDTANYSIAKMIKLPDGSEPHGLRISPDGRTAYIAMFAGKAMGILNLTDDTFRHIPMGAMAVQAGVTPDGNWAMVSLYETKQLALYNIKNSKVERIQLPADAKGPIQMYPTPDSKYVYLADQGYYAGAPGGNKVYKIDLATRKVVKTITAGDGPHGVVLSPDGSEVYITNFKGNDLSVISTVTDTEVAKFPVGGAPNGVSYWMK